MKLYSFFRSSASYRVRVAFHLKGLPFETMPVHLNRDGGDQNKPAYRAVNPQGRVPALQLDDGTVIGQSLAIIDYLETIAPEPSLHPRDPVLRARGMAVALMIAADIHPLNGNSVLAYLRQHFGADDAAIETWYRHWIAEGFRSVEKAIDAPAFAFGPAPTLVDICIAGQVINARRFKVDMTPFPKIRKVEAKASEHPAFVAALPENQPDAE